MKITVKEAPGTISSNLNLREQRDAVLAAAVRHRVAKEDCERQAVALDAKIARLSRTEKTYVLELTEREAAVIVSVAGKNAPAGSNGGPQFVLSELWRELRNGGAEYRDALAPRDPIHLSEVWPEDLK